MDTISNPDVREMVIMKSAQVGATEGLIGNAIGYFVDQDPSPIIVVQPTDKDAEDWSKTKLAPMIRDTPQLEGKIAEARSRDSDDTILNKSFPNGFLAITGAQSPRGLRRKSARVALCDEVDAYEASAGTEGDPIKLVEKRLIAYWNRLLLMASTPTTKGLSRIEKAFEASDQRYYHVPCPHCGCMQVLRWGTKDSEWGIKFTDRNPETACYQCVGCKRLVEEHHKREMVLNGEWIPSNPSSHIPGWHINALISLFDGARWPALVGDFLEAKRLDDRELLKVFVNTTLGETWDEPGETITPESLASRAAAYPAEVPAGVGVLTAGVDVQVDRLEMIVKGWGDAEESWLIAHHRIHGDPEKDETWARLEALLTKPYKHESGTTLRIRAMMIDSGYKTAAVYRFVRPRQARNVFASKGVDERAKAPLSRASRANRDGVKLFSVGTIAMKDTIFARLRLTRPGPRYMHFCKTKDGPDAEYFAQFGAEKAVWEKVKGRPVRKYIQIRERNEAIDLEVLALAALHSLGRAVRDRLDYWVRRAQKEGEKQQAEKESDDVSDHVAGIRLQKTKRPKQSKGWVGRWR
jgi:phage terminase large subunit GpA-like protein